MKLRPLGNNVLARVLPDERKTSAGIVLPQEFDRVAWGVALRVEVLAVGPQVDPEIQPGCVLVVDPRVIKVKGWVDEEAQQIAFPAINLTPTPEKDHGFILYMEEKS